LLGARFASALQAFQDARTKTFFLFPHMSVDRSLDQTTPGVSV
jgi:hypothetical protein